MNFRKHICLFLAFFLLVSNMGFAVNVHYCGNEISGISLKPEFSPSKTGKDCCGMTIKKSDCCKSKVVHFQKKSENTVAKIFAFEMQHAIPTPSWNPIVFSPTANFKSDRSTSYYCDANAPPLFKLYSQYIFYDSFNV